MFKVDSLDHVHVMVGDKFEAANWYEDVVGLTILEEKRYWASGDGPLVISPDNGGTALALFSGTGDKTEVAFRVSADGFLEYVEHAIKLKLGHPSGEMITRQHIVDHDGAFSLYVCDPWGNTVEVTSYECEKIKANLTA